MAGRALVTGVARNSRRVNVLVYDRARVEDVEWGLQAPKPLAAFEGFGASSLDLALRCYIVSFDYRLATTTALYEALYKQLAEAKVSIAFTPRDIHLNTSQPLDLNIIRPDSTRRKD